MKTRCSNPNFKQWADYGGRGIRVCQKWYNFLAFLEDMGERPEGYQLDRIDNDGDYEPQNCRWVPPAKNRKNRTRGVTLLTFEGKTMCLSDWAQYLGMKRSILSARINRLNWSVDRALTTPVKESKNGSGTA